MVHFFLCKKNILANANMYTQKVNIMQECVHKTKQIPTMLTYSDCKSTLAHVRLVLILFFVFCLSLFYHFPTTFSPFYHNFCHQKDDYH